ncbi:MAG: hypothetical protein A2785_02805 [Candidatus Chisholmbacteria bacterium RIFCSPHIGHO2_01_FULL_49_18]|uniref:Uncharacterized protein n=1 Tax=Candidatus Chisholmbacteria bacterium RIFCSPHIGHO2_01_FULL_49_18 TaxID=1797590 RepID=A0A1G1VL20_9BACT|nr:MAG: hypothetical protein A2785_02805 [Candidatus Chisholmbacteria bacterium RIFCSPHIGHO2_01_FULL_49_18]
MKFSKSIEIKASVCKLSGLLSIAKHIKSIYNKEKDISDQPEFKLERLTGENISFNSIQEFEKFLHSSITSIRGFNLSYWGKSIKIEFQASRESKNLIADITSTKEGNILTTERRVKEVFEEKSWNNYSAVVFYILYFFLYLVILSSLAIKFNISMNIITPLFYLSILPPIWLEPRFSSLYPGLVITHEHGSSGRILKRDVWFLLLILVIPYLINRF